MARGDEDVLDVLHLCEGLGLSAATAGSMLGLSRNAVLGIRHRVRTELAESEAGDPDPRRHDGTMPPEWWRDGLDRRR